MKLTAEQKARLAELVEMRKAGPLTDSELKELNTLQELAAKEAPVAFDAEQVKELVATGVKAGNAELQKQVDALLEKNSKMIHADQEYKGYQRGVAPVISLQRKEAIGADLRDFILGAKETKALTELSDAAGGILIPVEFRDSVIWYAGIYGIARRLCNYNRMASKSQQIDAVANEPVGYWVDEDGDSTESTMTFADLALEAKELAILVTASKQFIADLKDSRGIDVFDLLSKAFGKAAAKKEDEQFINGTGAPFTGILGSADVPAVVMAGASFSEITYGDLIDLTRKVPVEFKKGYKPVFVMHQDSISHVEKLEDTSGSLIFKRGLNDGEGDRLLGFLVEYSDVAPATSDDDVSTPFIAFGDPDHCSFGDRESLEVDIHKSGTVGGVNLITKRRIGIQATERVAITIHNPLGFAKLVTAAE